MQLCGLLMPYWHRKKNHKTRVLLDQRMSCTEICIIFRKTQINELQIFFTIVYSINLYLGLNFLNTLYNIAQLTFIDSSTNVVTITSAVTQNNWQKDGMVSRWNALSFSFPHFFFFFFHSLLLTAPQFVYGYLTGWWQRIA